MVRKTVKWFLIVLSIAVMIFVLLTILFLNRDHDRMLLERKGELSGLSIVEQRKIDSSGEMMETEIRCSSSQGIEFSARIMHPQKRGNYPVVIIMGGLATGKNSLTYLGPIQDTVLIGVDYPYKGKKRSVPAGEFIISIPRIYGAILNTPGAVFLLIDSLEKLQSFFTVSRITLIGGSLGALFCPVIAALDGRIDSTVILFGAADLPELLEINMNYQNYPWPVPQLSRMVSSLLLRPLEPSRYISRISPRTVMMLNGTGDPRMPQQFVERLYHAAQQPKELIWLNVGHVHIKDKRFRQLIGTVIIDWLIEHGDISGRPETLQIDSEL